MNKDTKIIKAISITMSILMFVALSITFWVLDTRYLDDIQCSVLYLIYTAVMWLSMETAEWMEDIERGRRKRTKYKANGDI